MIRVFVFFLITGTAFAQTPAQFAALQAQVTALQKQVTALQNNTALALAPFVTVDPNPQLGVPGPNITFHNANIHIVNGMGQTQLVNGLGNLIIGYNDDPINENNTTLFAPTALVSGDRGGSHNLVMGRWNRYLSSSFGGIIAGEGNSIFGECNSVLGGESNLVVQGNANVVVGGARSQASGSGAVISGGWGNATNSSYAVICGGAGSVANAWGSVIVGGYNGWVYPNASASVILGGGNVTVSQSNVIAPNPSVSVDYATAP
jgi:hypothetical protein